MKLDATALRYLTPEEFRVLTAVEMGSKNHHVVPTQLIAQISGLRSGGVNKILGELLKRKLVGREGGKGGCELVPLIIGGKEGNVEFCPQLVNVAVGSRSKNGILPVKDDGFRLAYGGYDYLAIRSMSKRDTVVSVGNQIGTGKESDIYVVADAEGEERVLKIHRLGRVSFRSIKTKRDYLRKGQSAGNWMYLSRLAATKEYAFMKVLHAHGFPVPEPFDHSRHCLLMSLIPSFPLRQVANIPEDEVPVLYSKLMDLIVRLANCGLIHGDFNEFNLLVKEKEDGGVDPILIDFPQMVSTEHENAEFYFNRDVECIRKFFRKRFNYESNVWPRFSTILKEGKREFELDVEVEASGWKGGKEGKVLEDFIREMEEREDERDGDDGTEDEEEDVSDAEGEERHTEPERDAEPISNPKSLDDDTSNVADEAAHTRRRSPSLASNSSHSSYSSSRSRSPSPARTTAPERNQEVKTKVAKELMSQRMRQEKKFHSKKGSTKPVGRRKGSKMKSDARADIKGF